VLYSSGHAGGGVLSGNGVAFSVSVGV